MRFEANDSEYLVNKFDKFETIESNDNEVK